MQVTKKILKAFRSDKLDRVYFCSHSEDKGSITIFNNDGSIFGMEGVEASLDAYGESKQRKFEFASANVLNYVSKDFNVMGTVGAFLKLGDEIFIEWIAGNNNGYLINSLCNMKDPYNVNERLYQDELRLIVKRKGVNYPFQIYSNVTVDSPARTVRFKKEG